ncbi:MAG: hypothetical protein WHX93_10965 [bacterium]
MLTVITNSSEISRYQQEFEQYLHRKLARQKRLKIGHLGASYEVQIHTDGDLWYTGTLAGRPEPNRYWNAFGLLSSDHPSNIILEINFPLQGINRRIAGVFVRDTMTDEVLLLHRGGVGGGRQGVGKQAFLSWYNQVSPGRLLDFDEGIRAADKCILIGRLTDDELLGGIYDLVQKVRSFKNSVANH